MPQKQAGAIDRLPIICAAGKPQEHSEVVGDLFRVYPKEDLAEKLVKEKDRLHELSPGVPATPIIPEMNQLKDVLAPDLNKSRFLEFRDGFYEKLYCKKVKLGKPKPAYSKPDNVTNESHTFGRLNPKAESAYNLALPKKSPDEVLREYVKWHDKYRLSHGDFYPSERIRRGYNEQFNKDKVFGEYINVDTSGKQVKSIMQDFDSYTKMHIISKAQEDFITHHKSFLGQPLRREGNGIDPNKAYGRVDIPDAFHVKELLNSTVSPEKITEYANVTTYRAFARDFYVSPLDCRGPAGQMQSQYPRKRECKLLAENLGEETTAKQLISPSIPTHFGLSHRDFWVPRTKEQIKRIFTKAGFELKSDEHFEKVWNEALTEWTSYGDKVSVEAFKYAYNKVGNKWKESSK